jgi:hypothetical protein
MKICYKAVMPSCMRQKIFRSAAAIKPVYYELNKWTYAPEETRLFVFETLDDLKRSPYCYTSNSLLKIFECEVKGGFRGYPATEDDDHNLYWDIVNSILKKKKSTKEFFNVKHDDWLLNTSYPSYLVKAVKLIEEIKL